MSKPWPVIWGHQGMGDHLICNGIYRAFAERGPITVCCLHRDEANVRHMISDLPHVKIWPWPDEDQMNRQILNHPGMVRIGSQNCGLAQWCISCHHRFDQAFYEQMGVPFEDRWKRWNVPPCDQIENQCKVFVHEKPDHPIDVNGDFVLRPLPGVMLFRYLDAMLKADEIHCANSAFATLADSYDLTGKRLYFYLDNRPVPRHRNKWHYIFHNQCTPALK